MPLESRLTAAHPPGAYDPAQDRRGSYGFVIGHLYFHLADVEHGAQMAFHSPPSRPNIHRSRPVDS